MAEYQMAQKGPLKLKGVGSISQGKKKKKAKEKNKVIQEMLSNKKNEEEKKKPALDKRTPAQLAFEKMQEKRQMERILKKASTTHKQRVETVISYVLEMKVVAKIIQNKCGSFLRCTVTSMETTMCRRKVHRFMFAKGQIERILKKASTTHKQRVEDLDTLTEHGHS